MSNGLKREAAQLAAAVADQGFRVVPTRRGHYLFFRPDGDFICDLSGTPGSKKQMTNVLKMLQKAGFDRTPKQTRTRARRAERSAR